MSRYDDRPVGTNNLDQYRETLELRGVKKIKQHRTGQLKQYEDKDIYHVKRI